MTSVPAAQLRRIVILGHKPFLGEVAGGSFESPSLINIRPLTMDFFAEIDLFLKDNFAGCQCKLVGAFNRALGCEKAAMMHLDPNAPQQREDWLDHFYEEDVVEVPLLSAMSLYDRLLLTYAQRISSEHATFRKMLYWQPKQLEEHAAMEDRGMKRLIQTLKKVIQEPA